MTASISGHEDMEDLESPSLTCRRVDGSPRHVVAFALFLLLIHSTTGPVVADVSAF